MSSKAWLCYLVKISHCPRFHHAGNIPHVPLSNAQPLCWRQINVWRWRKGKLVWMSGARSWMLASTDSVSNRQCRGEIARTGDLQKSQKTSGTLGLRTAVYLLSLLTHPNWTCNRPVGREGCAGCARTPPPPRSQKGRPDGIVKYLKLYKNSRVMVR